MLLVDSFPTHKIGEIEYRAGHAYPFGATIMGDAVNFSVFSTEATSVSLLFYHHGEKEPFVEIPITDEFRVGDVYSVMVMGLNIETTEYGYRMDGPSDPARGLRFDPAKPLLDPYAKSVSGRSVWGKEPDWSDPFQHRGQIIREDYDWEPETPLEIPLTDLVIYEAHVRGFTRHPSGGVRHAGTFAGLREKVPYLKSLGINCVELLPVFAFDEFESGRPDRLNYWG